MHIGSVKTIRYFRCSGNMIFNFICIRNNMLVDSLQKEKIVLDTWTQEKPNFEL